MAGEIMRLLADEVKPYLRGATIGKDLGCVVLGTVEGDIHDIGKDIVGTLLGATGFEVVDLGVDVPAERFAAAVADREGCTVGLSCLLTTGFESMETTVKAIEAAGLRSRVNIMIGGASVTEQVRRYSGADAFGNDAAAAVDLAKGWSERRDGAVTGDVVGAPGAAADPMFEDWQDLTWRQRRARRFERWLRPPGVELRGEDTKRLYEARVQGVIDAVDLKKPARLPVYVMLGMYPARWSGWSAKDAMSDYRNFAPVWGRLHEELDFDFVSDALVPSSFYETIGAKFIKWPGHGVGENSPWQYSGEEHMKDDEYDRLIDDPSDFWLRSLLPRMAEAFEPFEGLSSFTRCREAFGLVYRTLPFAETPRSRRACAS